VQRDAQDSLTRAIGRSRARRIPYCLYDNIAYGRDKPHKKNIEAAARIRANPRLLIQRLTALDRHPPWRTRAETSAGEKQAAWASRGTLAERPAESCCWDEAQVRWTAKQATKFQGCAASGGKGRTVLTIATPFCPRGRSRTIVVLEQGEVVENRHPLTIFWHETWRYAQLGNGSIRKRIAASRASFRAGVIPRGSLLSRSVV